MAKNMKEQNQYIHCEVIRHDIMGNPVIHERRMPSDPELRSAEQIYNAELTQLFSAVEAHIECSETTFIYEIQINSILEDLQF